MDKAVKPVRVFISYRHADHGIVEELRDHLGWLENDEQIKVFVDKDIDAGDDWDERIKAELEQAEIVILVVTARFMRSSYCTKIEMQRALERRAEAGVRVISIIAETCYWQAMPITSLAALPKDKANDLKPLNKWRADRDVALTQIAQHVHRNVENLAAKPRSDAPSIDLARYRARAQERWAAVDLTTLVQPGRENPDAAPIRLQDVFIAQACRRSRPAQVLPRDYRERKKAEEADDEIARRWQSSAREPVLDLLAAPEVRRLVLLGDPGAGKSALARYLLLALLDEATPADAAWLSALRPRIPFLIELKDYVAREAERRCTDLLDYLGCMGRDEQLGFDADAVRGTIGRAPVLLILDGLDEIFDRERRERLTREIIGLANHPELRVLVTSRIAGFKEHFFKAADFLTATLDDLDDPQIQAFAESWFRLAWRNEPARAESKRTELLQALKDRPPLRTLAGNPLLLTVMALVLRHQSLARTRVGLYEQCVKLLCHHWDFERDLHAAKHPLVRELNETDKEALLQHVAWAMQTTPDGLQANAIADEALEQALESYFASVWSAEPAEARKAARELVELLQSRNWMLCPRGPRLFGFVHRTFLEYLVARALLARLRAHEISLDQLITIHIKPHVKDENWHEIIPLLTALVGGDGPALAGRLINAINPSTREMVNQSVRLGLAFRSFAELDIRQLPKLGATAERLIESLVAWLLHSADTRFVITNYSSGKKIASSLDVIGYDWPNREMIVNNNLMDAIAASWEYSNLHSASEALLGSILGDLPQVRGAATTSRDARLRAVSLAALARSFIHDPEMLHFVRDRAQHDPDPRPRGRALRALVEHAAKNTEALRFVRDRAQHDPDPWPRGQALEALSILTAVDAETMRFVRERAEHDPEPELRGQVLTTLSLLAIGDAETMRFVRERAERDPNPGPRGEALWALGLLAKGNTETLRFIHERAQHDADPRPRRQALSALAQHTVKDPETLRLFRERACDDQDGSIRGIGLLAWAKAVRSRTKAVLVSRDLDAEMPGLDLDQPIDADRVDAAAAKLGLTPAEVRARYEALAREFPLRLAWQPG